MSDLNHADEDLVADADLVLRSRSGDSAAFAELWRRHYPSGMAVARSITSSIDPDDLVQESYTRIYNAILKGGGPNGSFRAYLFTSIRNTAAAWGKARRETAIDEMEAVADPASTDGAAEEALDRGLTAQAFRSLPTRWQEVLWYSEIEQMKPAAIAPLLGMRPGAVAQLAFRAREGLREAWIQAHLNSAAEGSDCRWSIERMGAYSRGNLGSRDTKRLEDHLEGCARCLIVAAEAKDVSSRLALVLLPLVLGVTGSAGYLATIQGGGAPIVAMAMPAGVVGGAAGTAGAAGAAGKAAGAFAAAGAGQGSSGAGAGAGAGAGVGAGAGATAAGVGAISGIGALIGAGSAALVVAGVVAAATIIPGLGSAPVATSLPTAADVDDSASSITTEVEPDETLDLAEDPLLKVDEPTPPPVDDVPEQEPPVANGPLIPGPPTDEIDDSAGGEDVAGEPVEGGSDSEPVDPGAGGGDEDPNESETPGSETEEPGTEEPETPETEEPETETPETEEPETEEPETEAPETEAPETEEPETETPETEEPDGSEEGTTDPTDEDSEVEPPAEEQPVAPTGPVTIGESEVGFVGTKLQVTITVHGVPGSTVRVGIDEDRSVGSTTVLDADGTGVVDVRPTAAQLARMVFTDVPVYFDYMIDGVAQFTTWKPLDELIV